MLLILIQNGLIITPYYHSIHSMFYSRPVSKQCRMTLTRPKRTHRPPPAVRAPPRPPRLMMTPQRTQNSVQNLVRKTLRARPPYRVRTPSILKLPNRSLPLTRPTVMPCPSRRKQYHGGCQYLILLFYVHTYSLI